MRGASVVSLWPLWPFEINPRYKKKCDSPVRTCRVSSVPACRSPWWQSQVRWHHCNTGKEQRRCGRLGSGSALIKQPRRKYNIIWRPHGETIIIDGFDMVRFPLNYISWWQIGLFGLRKDISMSLSALAPKRCAWGGETGPHLIQLAHAFVQSDLNLFPTCTHRLGFTVLLKDTWGGGGGGDQNWLKLALIAMSEQKSPVSLYQENIAATIVYDWSYIQVKMFPVSISK